jgi:hypothetical protein
MNNLVEPLKKPEFKPLPLFINSGEMIKKVSGYDYYVSNFGRVYNSRLRCLRPRINRYGYQRVNLCKNGNKKCVTIHKLVAHAFMENPENKPCIDHKDRNRLNNHVSNLRYVTQSENGMNASKKKNNTSGFTGVYWCKSRDKWRALIMVDRKNIHLGYYDTKEEAIAARKAGTIVHHGIYAAK